VNNTFWLLIDKFITLGAGFVTTIILARHFSLQAFGEYNYLLTYVVLWGPLFSLGIARILLREFSNKPDKIGVFLTTACQARFYATLFFSIIALAIFIRITEQNYNVVLIAILLFSQLTSSLEVYEFWFQYKSLNKHVVKLRILVTLFFNILKICSAIFYPSILWIVIITALEWVSLKSGYYFLYKYWNQKAQLLHHFDKGAFKNLFQQSKYLIFSGIAAIIYLKIDILMLEHLASSKEVAIYSVAAKISEVWFVLPAIFVTVVSPEMLNWAKNNIEKYHRRTQEFFSLFFWGGLVATLATYFIAPYLIPFIFGDEYLLSVEILQIHIWALVFISLRQLFSHILVIMKFAQFSLFSQVSGAIVNIILNYILIPLYGGKGAAIATIISYAMSSYFCLIFSAKTRPIFFIMCKSIWPGYIYNLVRHK